MISLGARSRGASPGSRSSARRPGLSRSRSSVLVRLFLAALVGGTLLVPRAHTQDPSRLAWLDPYREAATRLIQESTSDDFAWRRLAELTDTYGHRFSGSENLDLAIAWALDTMKRDGLEDVRTEPVMVPRWVRGRESAELVVPPGQSLAILGLGGSIGTPATGIEAEVLVVNSFEDLRKRAADAKGRIVLFNAPFTTYPDTITYRTGGARAASRHGAVAALVRSVGPVGLRTPHTGSMDYGQSIAPIPAASVAAEDADRIARLRARGVPVRVRLTMDAHVEADVESANVVGEIRGRERPREIVLLGGHIDSWDVGTGASDDAVGCIVTWEAARLMLKLGLRPRRTVRIVLWTNEENGLRGGRRVRGQACGACRRSRVCARIGFGSLRAGEHRVHGQHRRSNSGSRYWHAARATRVDGSRRRRWRCGHRPDRAGGQHPDDGVPG